MFSKTGMVLVAVTAMVAGFWLSSALIKQDPGINATNAAKINTLPVARKIAVPELLKDDGSIFSNSDLQGHWSLMFFGYTNCPDICPVTLGSLAQARKDFGTDFPSVIFVSVDPERDTIELLSEYVDYFDPAFIGVTGKVDLIKALTLQMSVVYMVSPGASENTNDYIVDHSSSILVINPEGKLHAFLGPPHSVTSIVERVRAITNK